jgi:hypothetical protein
MMQKLIMLLLVTTQYACQQHRSEPKEFSQQQLQADLNQLVGELKAYHPGLYWYQTPAEFEQQFLRAYMGTKDGQNFTEFYKSVNQLTCSIGCGHTRTRMPSERYNQLLDTMLVLPMQVCITNDAIYTKNVVANIPKGTRIASVGGFDAADILTELRSIIPSDGYNITGKDYYIGPRFGLLLALYFGIEGPTTSIDYITPWRKIAQSKEIVLEPFRSNLPIDTGPILSLNDCILPTTKVLRIGTFSSARVNQSGLDYFNFLESAFSQLKKEKTETLIIDVRGNGGGNDHYGATLVSYITNEAFNYFEKIEVSDAYDGYGDIEEVDSSRHMISHRDLAKQEPAKNSFDGKVYILADGGSFSTTADFVSIAKNIGAAYVVGQETGGGACGNTSGNNKSITLANTGISVQIQMWGYTSAIKKDLPCGHGVLPDYKVVDLPFTDNDEMMELVAALLTES